MKKLLKLALSFMMVFSLMSVVSADETPTTYIELPNNGHTYEIYQIFTGDLSGGKLINVAAGKNFKTGEDVKAALTVLESTTGSNTEKLTEIQKYVTLANPYKADLKAAGQKVSVDPGYYLIKDKDNAVTGNDAYTLYIVKVVGQVTIEPKSSVPTVVKKVQEDSNDQWLDAADFDIGQEIPYKLTATLADISNYKTYYVQFVDTMSQGLTYIKDSATVTIDGVDVTTAFTIVCNKNANNESVLTITCNDVKTIGATNNSVIEVLYKAKLNEKAVIGYGESGNNTSGNPNTVKLIYSNNPNVDQNGNQSTNKGETPEDQVSVFTYRLTITKSDENYQALEGAEFELRDAKGNVIQATENLPEHAYHNYFDRGAVFNYEGLDAGTYTLVETKAPEGYNLAEPITFEIVSVLQQGDIPSLNSITIWQNKKQVSVVLEGDATEAEIMFYLNKYGYDINNMTEDELAEFMNQHMFEITAHLGFIHCPSCNFVGFNVVNNAGATLPETGGMGTTMLYVGGSVLMLGAAILLVSKKRMSTVK